MLISASISALRAAIVLALAASLGCNGFGTGNATEPGSTPDTATQKNFRMVGNIGTPFLAIISDTHSSWEIRGVVPLNIIIVNGPSASTRIVATKLANDTRLLGVEAISGFDVTDLSSTYTNYGNLVAKIGGAIKALAKRAYPDVRFFVRNPNNGVFNAVVEDQTNAYVLQSRSPTLILYDSPVGNPLNAHIDGIFSTVSGGPMAIDLSYNGHVVTAGGGGTVSIKIN